MNRWFRFYEEAAQHPKVLLLPSDTLRWQWVVLLTVASQNDGVIPSAEVAGVALRVKPAKAALIITQLVTAELLDKVDGGYFAPRNWNRRQFKSDKDVTSADRQKRYRERHKTVTSRGSNALRNEDVTSTETEAETEKRETETRAREPLVSREAFELTEDIAKSHKADIESPDFYGFPMMAQMWLAEKIPRDFILATCSRLPGKHQKYLDKAVRNSWAERQSQPDRPINGKDKSSSLTSAIDQHIQNFSRDGGSCEDGQAPARLLSHG